MERENREILKRHDINFSFSHKPGYRFKTNSIKMQPDVLIKIQKNLIEYTREKQIKTDFQHEHQQQTRK